MKKFSKVLSLVLGLSLLSVAGLLTANLKAEAAAYDSNYINFIPDPEANEKAIQLATKDEDATSIPVPLENLTTEQPPQAKQLTARAALQKYRGNEYKEIYGIYQWRINELAPVGFAWYENGIPSSVTKGLGSSLTFNSSKISDTGVGGWQYGYYWRKFSTAQGTFWASAWNKSDLLY